MQNKDINSQGKITNIDDINQIHAPDKDASNADKWDFVIDALLKRAGRAPVSHKLKKNKELYG